MFEKLPPRTISFTGAPELTREASIVFTGAKAPKGSKAPQFFHEDRMHVPAYLRKIMGE